MWRFISRRPEPEKECPPDLCKEWRNINWGDTEDELQYVRNFTPQFDDHHLRILLHGPPGAGKSSFINSVQSVLRGRIYRQALADNTTHDSFTKEYTTFKMLKDPESFYPFVFNDTMGLSNMEDIQAEDIKLILNGHVKDGYRFNPTSHLPESEEFYIKSPKANDKVHVLVCVIPADTLSIANFEVLEKIRNIRKEATAQKIPQLALLTKIDMAHPEIKENLKNVYKLLPLKKQMQMFSAEVGIPMNCIFPVKNYHEEIDMDDDMNSLILSAMRHMLTCGDDFINFIQSRSESS